MAKYRINHSSIINKANKIQKLAIRLNDEILELDNLKGTLQREWAGSASDEFRRKMEFLIRDIGETKRRMEKLSRTIVSVANCIQQEDEELIEREKQKETDNNWF